MMRRTLLTCAAALFMLLTPLHTASAEENGSGSLSLPLVQISAEDGANAEVICTLTADTADAPMPEGSQEGYTFTLSDSDCLVLPQKPEEGTWSYTLTAECKGGTVSPGRITLCVTAQPEAEPVVSAMLPDGEKCELVFTVFPDSEPVTSTAADTVQTHTTVSAAIITDSPKTGDISDIAKYTAAGMTFAAVCIALRKREKE
ncbi:MAG: hypothetical protein IJ874_07455 [Ruminococcus sp.]|nr:hypothetical protein [Ruminococcus sp.]